MSILQMLLRATRGKARCHISLAGGAGSFISSSSSDYVYPNCSLHYVYEKSSRDQVYEFIDKLHNFDGLFNGYGIFILQIIRELFRIVQRIHHSFFAFWSRGYF